jgi:hypothetical protein
LNAYEIYLFGYVLLDVQIELDGLFHSDTELIKAFSLSMTAGKFGYDADIGIVFILFDDDIVLLFLADFLMA